VLVIEVDVVGAEALQRAVERALDVLGRAVDRADVDMSPGLASSRLRANLVAISTRRGVLDRLADQRLVGQRPVEWAVSRK